MKIIGLTGGIATGKSTVSKVVKKAGYPLIDCDEIARVVVEPGKPALEQIVVTFGEEMLMENGELDRARLGSTVFSDPVKRKQLNKITHKYITIEIFKRMFMEFWNGSRMVFLDAPLLFEAGLHHFTKEIMVVYCEPDQQLARLIERDGFDPTAAEQRIASQMPLKEKMDRATILIDNTRSIFETEEQVQKELEKLAAGHTPEDTTLFGKFIVTSTSLLLFALVALVARQFLYLILPLDTDRNVS